MKKYLALPYSMALLILATPYFAMTQSPGGINAGLKIWLKADAGTSSTINGTTIFSWDDQSGNGRNHTQTTAARQPTFIGEGGSNLINYQPAIRFMGIGDGNANNDFLQVNNYLLQTDAFHVFTVSRYAGSNGSSWNTLYGFSADINHTDWYNQKISCRTNGTEKSNTTKTINYAISSSLMPKTGNQRVIWNGTVATFSNNGYNITTAASPTFTIGVDRNNTNPMVGDIQEAIVYAGAAGIDMTADQINRIQSYLAIKYGIELDPAGQADYTSGNGTVTWTGAGNTGYQQNIFGLGRDDASALYQKQAFSYGDSAISMYLGPSLTALNSQNTSTIPADNSFLIVGGNGLSGYNSNINYLSGTVFVNGTTTSDLNALSNRIWKAQTTTQASWTVNIQANKFVKATYLLVSNNTAFANGSTRIYPVTGGVVSNVEINNGEYLAFGTFASGPGGIGSNLAVWLRADVGTSTITNGAAITSWLDQSGKNRTHDQAVAANQPTFEGVGGAVLMNYNPGVRFDGSNDYMNATKYNTSTDAVHLFSVSRLNSSTFASWSCIYAQQAAVINATWYPQGGFICPSSYINGNRINASKAGINFGLNSYISPRSGNQRMIWNGNTASFSNATYNPTNFAATYKLGADADNTDPFQGVIQEVIIYADPTGADMTTNQIERIQSYLAIKYGVSLDSVGQADYTASDNATKFWTGTTNTGYRSNIFGLGRDDNSNLLQTQAFSYSDSTISVFLGATLEPLNTLNTSDITSNLNFLMLGDNNLTGYNAYGPYIAGTAFSNASTNIQLNYLSARIWRAQATGLGSWTVSLKQNKFGASGNTDRSAFLVSTTTAFTPATTRVYPVVGGIAGNVLINNGDYIAIGAFVQGPGGVSEKLALWTKTDDAGLTPTASWKDNSATDNPVETTGSMSLSAANVNHNYYPFYTSFTSSNHFYDALATMQPNNNFGTFTRTSYAMFSAVRPISLGTGRIVGTDNDDRLAAEPGFSLKDGNPYFFKFYEGTYSFQHTSKVTINKSTVITYNADQVPNAGNGQLKIGLDGNEQLFNMPAGNFFHVVGQRLRIGFGEYDLNGSFPGDIMEIAYYKKALTVDEASRVSSYLALKNGVTLGTNAAPIDYHNTLSQIVWIKDNAYQNNIAGIARDDAEALYQKQANSINENTNGQVIMSLGTPAVSNAANTNIFSRDNTYLMWGDNGITTSLATASTAFTYNDNSLNLRMNRIWQVQNNGMSDALSITIPQTMIGTVATNACQKLALVVATDAAFTNILSTSLLNISGSNYTITYKFPAGIAYFTFARLEQKANGYANLPMSTTPSISYNTCEEPGWRYFFSDGTNGLNDGLNKIFAINRNENGTATTLNNFSGTVTYLEGGVELTDPLKTSRVMGRMLTVTDPSSGTYNINGGMKLRLYYDSTELKSAILDAPVSAKWFKHSGDAESTLADQTTSTITNAVFLTPSATGTEDGVNYIELSDITSFSTFGFMSNAGSAFPLPVIIKSFTVNKTNNNTAAALNWKVGTEDNLKNYEILRSSNGISFETIATIPASGSNAYSYIDTHPLNGNNFYKLKSIDIDGRYAFSETKFIAFGNVADSYIIYPNPLNNGNTIIIQLSGYRNGAKCLLYNGFGQLVHTYDLKTGNNAITNTQALTAGIYIVKIINNETGAVATEKVIVK